MIRAIAPCLVAATLMIGGCTFDDPCAFEECGGIDVNGGDASAGDSESTNGGNVNDGGTNQSNSDSGSVGDVGPDATTNSMTADVGVTDSGGNGEPDSTTSEGCEVDIFSFECSDDRYEPNGGPSSGHYIDTIGCGESDTPTRLDVELTPRVCPLESADYFTIFLVPCDGVSVTLDVEFDVSTSCRDDLYSFDFRAPCQFNTDLTCVRDGNRFTMTHSGGSFSPGGIAIQFGIETEEDLFLDYSLKVRAD